MFSSSSLYLKEQLPSLLQFVSNCQKYEFIGNFGRILKWETSQSGLNLDRAVQEEKNRQMHPCPDQWSYCSRSRNSTDTPWLLKTQLMGFQTNATLKGKKDFLKCVPYFPLQEWQQWDKAGRILLGDNTGSVEITLWMISFQSVGIWISTGLHCIYI